MAKLYTAAQLQELQRLAANNKPLKSALEKVLSGRMKDLGSAEKKLLQQALNMSPKDFVAAIEARLGLGPKVRSVEDLPKPPAQTPVASATQAEAKAGQAETASKDQKPKQPKPKRQTVRSRAAEAAKKSAAQAEAKAGQAASRAKKQASKKASETASKAAKTAGKTAAKAGEATVKGASILGKGAGVLSAGAKALGPVAKVGGIAEAVNVTKILATDEGKQEAKDYATSMAEDNEIVRAAKAAWRPSDTIAGAFMNLADATKLGIAEDIRGAELDRTVEARRQANRDRMAALRAARAAKMKVADEPAVPVEEVEEEMGEPAIRKRDARSLDRLDERVLEDLPTEPVEDSDYDPTKNEMYGSGPNDDYAPTKNEMYGSGPEVEEPAPPKAVRVSPEELAENEKSLEQDAISMFKTTHGTEFDPKSSMDRGKLEKMKSLLSEKGGLKDPKNEKEKVKFALDFYRRFPES